MQKLRILLFGLAVTSTAYAGPFNYVANLLERRDYVYSQSDDIQFKACQNFQNDKEASFYATCDENQQIVSSYEIDELSDDVHKLSKEILRKDFVRDLAREIRSQMDERLKSVQALLSCLSANQCPTQKDALLSGMRDQLPKLRGLMAQKDMPGKIYSPTRPLRYQDRLKHDVTDVKVKDLSEREKAFLKEFTWNMEDRFEEQVKAQRPEIADNSAMTSVHVDRMILEQNKRYQKMYDEMVSANPLLSLVSLRGDENDTEMIQEAIQGLKSIRESLEEAKSELVSLEEEEPSALILYQASAEKLLERKNSQIYCEVAGGLSDDQDLEELKRDLLLGSAMLISGGACALTFGTGCVLGVAVAGEAMAIKMSYDRKERESQLFQSSQSSVAAVEERNFEHDLSLFLAPLSFVGEGFGNALVKNSKKFIRPTVARRFDHGQRGALDELEIELGRKKNGFLNKFNPKNKYDLSHRDEIYLAGIVSELKKQNIPESQIRKYLDELVTQCKGGQ